MESNENSLVTTVTGRRKCRIGLVVPTRYTALTSDKRTADILIKELRKKIDKYSQFQATLVTEKIIKSPLLALKIYKNLS